MIKRYFVNVIENMLRDITEDVHMDQLKLNLWKGEVALDQLRLKPSILEQLKLPVTLVEGVCHSINLKVSLLKIYSTPCVLEVSRLKILATTFYDAPPQYSNHQEMLYKDKMNEVEKLLKDNLLSEDSKKESFITRLKEVILNNIIIRIKECELRIESPKKLKIAFGLRFKSVICTTVDSQSESTFVNANESKIMHKKMEISGLEVYCGESLIKISKDTPFSLAQILKSRWFDIIHDGTPPVLFGPISVNFVFSMVSKQYLESILDTPCIKITSKLQTIGLNLDRKQYVLLYKLFNLFNQWSYLEEIFDNRPKVSVKTNPKAWWRYAACSVCGSLKSKKLNMFEMKNKNTKKVYLNFLEQHSLSNLDTQLMGELRALQESLSIAEIVHIRKIAQSKSLSNSTIRKQPVTDNETGLNLSQNTEKLEDIEDIDLLVKEIEAVEHFNHKKLPSTYCWLSISLTLPLISLTLTNTVHSIPTVLNLRLNSTDLQFKLFNEAGFYALSVQMKDMLLTNPVKACQESIPYLIYPNINSNMSLDILKPMLTLSFTSKFEKTDEIGLLKNQIFVVGDLQNCTFIVDSYFSLIIQEFFKQPSSFTFSTMPNMLNKSKKASFFERVQHGMSLPTNIELKAVNIILPHSLHQAESLQLKGYCLQLNHADVQIGKTSNELNNFTCGLKIRKLSVLVDQTSQLLLFKQSIQVLTLDSWTLFVMYRMETTNIHSMQFDIYFQDSQLNICPEYIYILHCLHQEWTSNEDAVIPLPMDLVPMETIEFTVQINVGINSFLLTTCSLHSSMSEVPVLTSIAENYIHIRKSSTITFEFNRTNHITCTLNDIFIHNDTNSIMDAYITDKPLNINLEIEFKIYQSLTIDIQVINPLHTCLDTSLVNFIETSVDIYNTIINRHIELHEKTQYSVYSKWVLRINVHIQQVYFSLLLNNELYNLPNKDFINGTAYHIDLSIVINDKINIIGSVEDSNMQLVNPDFSLFHLIQSQTSHTSNQPLIKFEYKTLEFKPLLWNDPQWKVDDLDFSHFMNLDIYHAELQLQLIRLLDMLQYLYNHYMLRLSQLSLRRSFNGEKIAIVATPIPSLFGYKLVIHESSAIFPPDSPDNFKGYILSELQTFSIISELNIVNPLIPYIAHTFSVSESKTYYLSKLSTNDRILITTDAIHLVIQQPFGSNSIHIALNTDNVQANVNIDRLQLLKAVFFENILMYSSYNYQVVLQLNPTTADPKSVSINVSISSLKVNFYSLVDVWNFHSDYINYQYNTSSNTIKFYLRALSTHDVSSDAVLITTEELSFHNEFIEDYVLYNVGQNNTIINIRSELQLMIQYIQELVPVLISIPTVTENKLKVKLELKINSTLYFYTSDLFIFGIQFNTACIQHISENTFTQSLDNISACIFIDTDKTSIITLSNNTKNAAEKPGILIKYDSDFVKSSSILLEMSTLCLDLDIYNLGNLLKNIKSSGLIIMLNRLYNSVYLLYTNTFTSNKLLYSKVSCTQISYKVQVYSCIINLISQIKCVPVTIINTESFGLFSTDSNLNQLFTLHMHCESISITDIRTSIFLCLHYSKYNYKDTSGGYMMNLHFTLPFLIASFNQTKLIHLYEIYTAWMSFFRITSALFSSSTSYSTLLHIIFCLDSLTIETELITGSKLLLTVDSIRCVLNQSLEGPLIKLKVQFTQLYFNIPDSSGNHDILSISYKDPINYTDSIVSCINTNYFICLPDISIFVTRTIVHELLSLYSLFVSIPFNKTSSFSDKTVSTNSFSVLLLNTDISLGLNKEKSIFYIKLSHELLLLDKEMVYQCYLHQLISNTYDTKMLVHSTNSTPFICIKFKPSTMYAHVSEHIYNLNVSTEDIVLNMYPSVICDIYAEILYLYTVIDEILPHSKEYIPMEYHSLNEVLFTINIPNITLYLKHLESTMVLSFILSLTNSISVKESGLSIEHLLSIDSVLCMINNDNCMQLNNPIVFKQLKSITNNKNTFSIENIIQLDIIEHIRASLTVSTIKVIINLYKEIWFNLCPFATGNNTNRSSIKHSTTSTTYKLYIDQLTLEVTCSETLNKIDFTIDNLSSSHQSVNESNTKLHITKAIMSMNQTLLVLFHDLSWSLVTAKEFLHQISLVNMTIFIDIPSLTILINKLVMPIFDHLELLIPISTPVLVLTDPVTLLNRSIVLSPYKYLRVGPASTSNELPLMNLQINSSLFLYTIGPCTQLAKT